MLRQVFIFYKNEIIFQYFFAKAYDKEALEIVLKKRLITYITNPIENKILSRPLLDFQSHFVFINGVFFLFVTDMADRPKIIAKEMERASKLFLKNFPDPLKIKESSPEKEEFTIFIKETHYYLHPKISLIGSLGAGKSTIVEILNQEKSHGKKIMDFAFYYRIQMGEIYFDLWDFITRDDFSPLWNNFVRGSDVIFFVIDGSNLNDEKIKFFTNLKRREGKYSNWAIILTHSDSPNFLHAPNLKEKYNYLKDVNIYEINLTDSNVLRDLSLIFIKTIGLKESLPPEFRTLLVQANNLVAEEKLSESIN
ncbi:MAG: ADP-ribosylation factor-like protein, partial [Promethearchaeota archaeon]